MSTLNNVIPWYKDVVKWNVMFGNDLDIEKNGQLYRSLIKEEYQEYQYAESDEERLDAMADLIYVTLGLCAMNLTPPEPAKFMLEQAAKNTTILALTSFYIDDIDNSPNQKIPASAGALITLIILLCERDKLDLSGHYRKVQEANWSKFWQEADLKTTPASYKSTRTGGWVVKNSFGKIMKPPGFAHP